MATRRYRYRAYLTPNQEHAAARVFGCTRVAWNTALHTRKAYYAEHKKHLPEASKTLSRNLTALKHTPEYAYLRDVSSGPLQQALRDLDQAYANFFASLRGNRQGPRIHAPTFKKRTTAQSARFTRSDRFSIHRVNAKWSTVRLPKIGYVKFRRSRELPSAPTSVTLIRSAAGNHYVSFVVDTPTPEPTTLPSVVCGIDLGLTDFAAIASSDGTRKKITAPRFFRQRERKLRKAQQALSRCQKGSKRRARAKHRVAIIHEATRNQRQEFARALARTLTRENQAIGVETLAIKSLTKKGKQRLAKSIHDAGWGIFLSELSLAAAKTGCTIVRVERTEPTTRRCGACGIIGARKPLSVRQWVCTHCSASLDRDYNAAVNIMVAAGLADTQNERGGHVSRLALTG